MNRHYSILVDKALEAKWTVDPTVILGGDKKTYCSVAAKMGNGALSNTLAQSRSCHCSMAGPINK